MDLHFQTDADRQVAEAAMAIAQQWKLIAQLELEGTAIMHAEDYLQQLETKLASLRAIRAKEARTSNRGLQQLGLKRL